VLGGPQEDIHYLAGRATKHPSSDLPVMRLDDLLLCGSSKTTEGKVANVLRSHLERFGFVVLRYSPTSEAGQVVHDLKRTVDQDLFPTDDKLTRNPSHLGNGHTYVSERGVPMWRLGYEECDDIREVRLAPLGNTTGGGHDTCTVNCIYHSVSLLSYACF
jgi:hypothetical protein